MGIQFSFCAGNVIELCECFLGEGVVMKEGAFLESFLRHKNSPIHDRMGDM